MKTTRDSWDVRVLKWGGIAMGVFVLGSLLNLVGMNPPSIGGDTGTASKVTASVSTRG